MRFEFKKWVFRTLLHPEERGLDLGDLGMLLERRSHIPLEDVFLEFEAEIEECLENLAVEIDQGSAIGYTQNVFGLDAFESEQDRKFKMLELAAFHAIRTP